MELLIGIVVFVVLYSIIKLFRGIELSNFEDIFGIVICILLFGILISDKFN